MGREPLRLLLLLALLGLPAAEPAPTWTIAVHGGAGAFDPSALPPPYRAQVEAGLARALAAGGDLLAQGGSAVDAVQAAVLVLEEDPLFNAGKGAVFTHDGRHELDAAIMDGAGQRAGAATGVQRVRNPILLARRVMEASGNVLLAGEGAERFARDQGLELVDPTWFDTDAARQGLQRALRQEDAGPHGTVGAVARDQRGHLAAATSTGGRNAKRPGRVGDSPLIGAGTWAQDGVAAVSCTGYGEFFIRHAAAHGIAARIELAGRTPAQAAAAVIVDELGPAGGEGAAIVVGAAGDPVVASNVGGMFHGWLLPGRPAVVRFAVPAP